jgi:hypothetical protein
MQVQLIHRLDRGGETVLAGHELSTPVQHQVLATQEEHAALATPWYPRSQ